MPEKLLGIVRALEQSLNDDDYLMADKLVGEMNEIVSNCDNLEKDISVKMAQKYIVKNSLLFDRLMYLADTLFVKSPVEKLNRELFHNIEFVRKELENTDGYSCSKINSKIELIVKEHNEQLQKIETDGFLEKTEFCLFWKLWLILDESIRKFDDEYEEFSIMLYGLISPALRMVETSIGLGTFKNDIFDKNKQVKN